MGAVKEVRKTATSGVYREGRKKVRDLDGLAYIAMLDTVLEKVEIMRDKAIEDMEDVLFSPYWDEVQNAGVHELTSYEARDQGHTAKVAFTRKRSDIELKADERRKLSEANITLPAPAGPRIAIKSEYLKDETVLRMLEKLLELGEKNGIVMPADFLEPASQKVTMNKDTVFDALSLDWQTSVQLLPILGKMSVKECKLSPSVPITKALKEVLAKLAEEEKVAKAA
jgi:hypothetical protein